jgi:hypothetical protein
MDLLKYTIATEEVLFDPGPIMYRVDEWVNRYSDQNILYITGLSGGGKGYYAKQLAKTKASSGTGVVIVELDKLENYQWYVGKKDDNPFVAAGDKIIFDWLGKLFDDFSIDYWAADPKYYQDVMRQFMTYFIEYAKEHQDTKFIVEGVQIFFDEVFREIFNTKDKPPIVVIRTSKVHSMTKVMNREHNQIRNKLHSKNAGPDALADFIKFLAINSKYYCKSGQ